MQTLIILNTVRILQWQTDQLLKHKIFNNPVISTKMEWSTEDKWPAAGYMQNRTNVDKKRKQGHLLRIVKNSWWL